MSPTSTPPRAVLIAPDKFKGSLSGAQVADAIARGVRRCCDVETISCPVADGGDGTVAAAVAAGYAEVSLTATGPTGEPVHTHYARSGETAVIEMAAVSGLAQLPSGDLAPMIASSRGIGEVLAAAIDVGCTHIVLGIGGSASTDGGSGLLAALGAVLTDDAGVVVADGGAALASVAHVELSVVRERMDGVSVVVACDVDNPLTGRTGAAAVYGPQKGADEAQVQELDAALGHFADVLSAVTGRDERTTAGAGAAGGVGYAGVAVLGAQLRPGVDVVFELLGFTEHLRDVDVVITGEGSLDEQTLSGKAPAGVASVARKHGIPVVAVCGRSTLSVDQVRAAGFGAVYALSDLEPDVGRSMMGAQELLEQLGEQVGRDHLA